MQTAFDAIVAGAGPAGCAAALSLSAAGARVLLLEKRELGRDKPCGGGLTPRAWRGLEIDVEDVVESRASAVELRRRRRPPVLLNLGSEPVLMVRRSVFDLHLARAAQRAGAAVHDNEAVLDANADSAGVTVRTVAGTYRAPALLLATGAEGRLRDTLGFAARADRTAVGVEIEHPARAPGLHPSRIVFDYSVPGGYAWAFPKGETWNVGVLSSRRSAGPQLRRMLTAFIGRAGIEFASTAGTAPRVRGHRIPLWHSDARRVARGRVALLGDAAALADPLFGEGIAQALTSGRAAAAATMRLLRGEASDLSDYPQLLDASIGSHAQRMRWIAHGVFRAPQAATSLLAWPPAGRLACRMATERFAPLHAAGSAAATSMTAC